MQTILLDNLLSDIINVQEYMKHIMSIEKIAKEKKSNQDVIFQDFIVHMDKFRLEKRKFEYKSIIISLYGVLENHINVWIQEHINNISNIYHDYSSIPEAIHKNHFNLSIKLISILNDKRLSKYNHINKNAILEKLNTCVNGSKEFELNAEAFIPVSGNLTHNSIDEAFKKTDINLNTDLIRSEEFVAFLETIIDGNIQNKKVEDLYATINNLVSRRNDIAHGNDTNNILSFSTLEDYIIFITEYCKAIFSIIQEKELEYELEYSYQKINIIKKVYDGSILAFELEYYKISIGDYLIIKTTDNHFIKKEILEIQIDKTKYDTIIANEKIDIAIKVEKTINENQEFYIKKRNPMPNILTAFTNIVTYYKNNIELITQGNNRANNMGEGLEVYIKDIFAGTMNESHEEKKLEILEKVYSYQGNKNNPPDLMLKNSDAIEIKKLESKNSAIALNSSYPKARLYADNPMITNTCKACENWEVKDMLYSIGYTNASQLKSLWLVYGDCFCADKETYERIKETISNGINTISDVEFTETKELGKVKKVDPLGITDLRIRGMWHIDNPNKIFNYIYTYDETKEFQLICLLKKDKYETLPIVDRQAIENSKNENVEVTDVKIKNPNNPVQLIDAKLLVFKV